MSELNIQSTEAVIETGDNTAFTPEAAVTTVNSSAETRTLEESLNDVAVTGFTTAVSTDASEVASEEELGNPVFLSRGQTNMIVHRRENPDKSFEFIVTDEDNSWLRKNDTFVTGNPIGVEETDSLLQLLADETLEYFAVLDSDGEKETLGDKGDIRNLTRLQAFAEDTNLFTLLTGGIRSINAGSRLLQKAISSTDKVINGAMTIAYQVHGQEGVMKYRLVGTISRELVAKIAEVSGYLATEVIKPIETKAKKVKPKTEVKKDENVVEAQGNNDAQVTEVSVRVERQPAKRTSPQGDASIQRLLNMTEALIIDNREIRKQLQNAQGFNQALQRELRDHRAVTKELLDTNKGLMSTLGVILDALTK